MKYTVKIPSQLYLIDTSSLSGLEKLKALKNNTEVLNKSVDGMAVEDIVNDAAHQFTLSDYLDVIAVGGEVLSENGLPFTTYVKIDDTLKNNIIPECLPNRMKNVLIDDTDPDNPVYEQQPKTWHEWFNPTPNYPTEVIEGYRYYLPYAPLSGKSYLNSTELILIHNSLDAELVDSKPISEEII